MTRVTKLWIAVAAVAITALLTVAAGQFVSLVMRVFLAHHDQWWWPLAINGLASSGWITPFVMVGIAVYRMLRGHHEPQRRGPHSRMPGRPPRRLA